jgi:phenylpyruvate tautomerase PptA (4-oxalocrotonate tautomerase family)
MPLIDVDLPEGLIPADQHERLAHDLGHALLAAEGLPDKGPILAHTSVYLHPLPPGRVYTLAGAHSTAPIRIRVTTAAGSLNRDAQRRLVANLTRIVTEAAADPSIARHVLVLHSEIAEGGWGSGGTALGRADFDRMNAALKGGADDHSGAV